MSASSDLYEDDLRKSTKELKRSSPTPASPNLDLCITALALEWYRVRDGEMLVHFVNTQQSHPSPSRCHASLLVLLTRLKVDSVS